VRRTAIVLVLLAAALAPAADPPPPVSAAPRPQLVRLVSPMSTLVLGPAVTGGVILVADVVVPKDAPPDLGVGAWIADRDGHWFQRVRPGVLPPGRQRLEFALDADAPLVGEPGHATWSPEDAAESAKVGLFFFSTQASHAELLLEKLVTHPAPAPAKPPARLLDLSTDPPHVESGARWSCTVLPQPFPANPYDPDDFALDAVFTGPDGAEQRVPGFYLQPMVEHDRGDREVLEPRGEGRFEVRFRPVRPGTWHVRLEARWRGGARVQCALADLAVTGMARDEVAHVDAGDPRFFAVGGAFFWPIGLNLNNPYDTRCRDVCATKLTPDRGDLVYDAMLARIAAAGCDACEIWMSSWNVGLEWRADWPGYHGIGRYNQGNAWKLDRILERARELGVRVNLVINNHGQASANADREWRDNPWNAQLGGPLEQPLDIFQDPAALAGQERLRRYIIGRFADEPSILGWKLWSEVDLTAARGEAAWRWHEQAAARWHALDIYRHPVTTHWAGDFRRVNPAVAVLPGIDYLCIDAYRRADPNGAWRLLADILSESSTNPARGLSLYRKPVLTTEFGASSGGAPSLCREVDHRTGAWAALVSGHGGAPMLWWWEWVDQGDRWQPYGAVRRFVAGEDLRGGRSAALLAQPDDKLWCRCWVKPGRLLGYLLDRRWGADGKEVGPVEDALIVVGDDVPPGSMRVEWWDADLGRLASVTTVDHPGGSLLLIPPSFARHVAFKIQRVAGDAEGSPAKSEEPSP
jgi:hypothetical protein